MTGSEDNIAATLAALNQQVKSLVAVLREINETLSKGANDGDGTGDAKP